MASESPSKPCTRSQGDLGRCPARTMCYWFKRFECPHDEEGIYIKPTSVQCIECMLALQISREIVDASLIEGRGPRSLVIEQRPKPGRK